MRGSYILLGLLAAVPAWCGDWNPKLAADYLDARQKQWLAWPTANANGAPCVSCHTGATYLMARPALRRVLGDPQPTTYETALLQSMRGRLTKRTPKEMFPSSTEPHLSEGAGVESIFSALFLNTPDAFERMWDLQDTNGAWMWNSFDLNPWEEPESAYFGAAMAALATGSASSDYRARPAVRDRVAALTAYLKTSFEGQPLHNRLTAVWASTKLPEALPAAARQATMDAVWKAQTADGSWTVDSLGPWKAHPAAPASDGSNAYATAYVAVVLEKAGIAVSDPRLARALDWLKSHQDPKGYWDSVSMNKVHKAESMPAGFMRDAATAYASLALAEAAGSSQR